VAIKGFNKYDDDDDDYDNADDDNQSINQSIKTHFYSAICRNESEAHVATRTRLSVQIVRFLKYD